MKDNPFKGVNKFCKAKCSKKCQQYENVVVEYCPNFAQKVRKSE
jgi:hypothetical protein